MHLAMENSELWPKRRSVAVPEQAGYCKKPTFNTALCSGVEVLELRFPYVAAGRLYPSRAASAAMCPASVAIKVLRFVIDDISENSPVVSALRGDVTRAAVV